MKKSTVYRGYTIWKNGFNYSIEMPSGNFFSDDAANIATAKKWIDMELSKYSH